MLLSHRQPLYELPPYSLTGDVLSFATCPLQYRHHTLGNLPPSRPVQLWFGQFIHGVMEEAFRQFRARPAVPPPWKQAEIDAIVERIKKRLQAQGLPARSRNVEKLGSDRAERAINLLGPHLLPLISRAEVLLRGARPIDARRMSPEWRQYRCVDRYELVGIVDVLSHVELQEAGASNLFVDQVCNRVPSLPSKFEIIVDYKGMRRPALTSRRGRLGLPIYEWQLQNYAHLRERQRSGVPVVAGVLVFLNELLPSTGDLQAWRTETSSNLTDVPLPPHAKWRSAADVPDEMKLRRAIHVTAVTVASRNEALARFDEIVQKIEACRAAEAAGRPIHKAWPPKPDDKGTCDACDERTFCPGYAGKHLSGAKLRPSLPHA